MESPPVVEESPPPPGHYLLFTDSQHKEIKPPSIPSEESLMGHLPFRHLYTNSISAPDVFDIVLFKLECNRYLDEILKLSLELSSQIPPISSSPQLKVHELINDMFVLLKSYREHEAREVLCEELKKQIKHVKGIENNLLDCIENVMTTLKN